MRLPLAALAATVMLAPALAQHNHPPQDTQLHAQFYSTWNKPNGGQERKASCCNLVDCYPASFKNVAGTWFVQRREDKAWIVVPDSILEHNQDDPRESPDGRPHVCTPAPHSAQAGVVFCAVLGGGI